VVPALAIAALAELRAQSGNGGNSGRGVGGLEGAEGRQQALAGRGVGGVRAHRLAHSGHDSGGRGCACFASWIADPEGTATRAVKHSD